jgi:putative membrane protein
VAAAHPLHHFAPPSAVSVKPAIDANSFLCAARLILTHPFKNTNPQISRRIYMKRLFILACCVLVASVPAISQKKAAEAKTMTDQQFVDFAAQTDMVEANLGQMAQNVADAQPVKDYGTMLDTDHTADYKQLADAAKQANLNVPTAIDAEHDKMMIDPFQKLKGAAFDHKYTQEMIAGHTKAIAIYKKEAADAQNDAIKSYAQAALATLEKHLSGAKDLEKAKTPAK